MPQIQVLSEMIANQIAAGEVVERPASIVKELVENSLDAGATRIDIEIESGGLEKITVSDDGHGMSKEDALLAFQRHATSKLKTSADLFRIASLGFRGEALPSIASVAHVELITRQHTSDVGHKVEYKGGQLLADTPWGTPPGTLVTVEKLFYNTPARQKFLKSPVAEAGRIRTLVAKLALAVPAVALRLTQDNRIVLETPVNARIEDAILAIYGREVASNLIEVHKETAELTITGLISRPELNRNNRRDQVFFINHRLVECRSLSVVLQEAYRSLLPHGRHALAFLNLELPHNMVDVNVHPAKIEVRLSEERQIAAIVLRTLRDALQEEATIGPAAATTKFSPPMQTQRQTPPPPAPFVPISLYRPQKEVAASGIKEAVEVVQASLPTTESPSELKAARPYKILGQALASYIVIERDDGLWIVDQHAAHERIIYEQLVKRPSVDLVAPMLMPYTLEVGAKEAAVLSDSQAELAKIGFEVEHFGGHTWALRSLPDVYRGKFKASDFFDLLAELADGWGGLKPDAQRERLLIRLACSGATKAGQRLHLSDMVQLLDQLWATDLPYTCPHGRPTALNFTSDQLFNLFHP